MLNEPFVGNDDGGGGLDSQKTISGPVLLAI